MLRDELNAITSTRRDLRNFGLVVGGVFFALGALARWKGRAFWPWLEVPGGLLVAFGALFPPALKPLQRAWMTLAVIMGFVMTRVILGVLFFGALLPVGLIARLFGTRFLEGPPDPGVETYWHRREGKPPDPAHFERQF